MGEYQNYQCSILKNSFEKDCWESFVVLAFVSFLVPYGTMQNVCFTLCMGYSGLERFPGSNCTSGIFLIKLKKNQKYLVPGEYLQENSLIHLEGIFMVVSLLTSFNLMTVFKKSPYKMNYFILGFCALGKQEKT